MPRVSDEGLSALGALSILAGPRSIRDFALLAYLMDWRSAVTHARTLSGLVWHRPGPVARGFRAALSEAAINSEGEIAVPPPHYPQVTTGAADVLEHLDRVAIDLPHHQLVRLVNSTHPMLVSDSDEPMDLIALAAARPPARAARD